MSTPARRRIFISSSSAVDTTSLSELLTERGYLVVQPKDLPPGDVAAGLRSLIEASDALIAVVGDALPAATLVEIGAAIGGGRPVVILAEGHADAAALPLMVRGLPTVVLGGADLSSAVFRLLDALDAPPATHPRQLAVLDATPQASGITGDPTRDWADNSERAVAEVFQAKGYRVVAQPAANTVGRVDLAAWIFDLGDPGLNPVLIEVAGRRPDTAAKLEKLSGFLRGSGLLLGILVTPDQAAPQLHLASNHAIVETGIGWLYTATSADIVRVLIGGRNALFHRSL